MWEWVQDWYGDYPGGTVTDPQSPVSGSGRVYWGGSWYGNASFCQSSSRIIVTPGIRVRNLSFRLLRTVP